MRYSKGWAILNEACTRTTMRRTNEGLVGDALELCVVKLMAKRTAALSEGLWNSIVSHIGILGSLDSIGT